MSHPDADQTSDHPQIPAVLNIKQQQGVSFFDEIYDWIERHLATASLEEAAKDLCCHPHTISRAIKSETDMTWSQLLGYLRIHQATRLLDSTDLPIDVVAHQCGYHNLTYFYRLFRELHGVTPGEYRRASEQAPDEVSVSQSAYQTDAEGRVYGSFCLIWRLFHQQKHPGRRCRPGCSCLESRE